MKVQYVETDKVTEDGAAIYHRRIPHKGRPAMYVRKGTRYVKYVRPIAKKTAVEAVEAVAAVVA